MVVVCGETAGTGTAKRKHCFRFRYIFGNLRKFSEFFGCLRICWSIFGNSKLYKVRTQLKNVTLSSIFPSSLSSGQRNHRIFINENLTNYRREMMSLALHDRSEEERCKDYKFLVVRWESIYQNSPFGETKENAFHRRRKATLGCHLLLLTILYS